MPSPTEIQAWAAIIQAGLAAVLVGVTIAYVVYSAKTVGELRESRVGGYLPLLQWQTPQARVHHELVSVDGLLSAREVWMIVQVVLWNIGPGPARIVKAEARSDRGETFEVATLGVPGTIPAPNQTEQLFILKLHPDQFVPAQRTLTVTVRYMDIFERRAYETRIKVLAHFEEAPQKYPPQLVHVRAEFIDSDERSARERRIR